MRVALYVRCSTADKQHPDAQLGPLREYAAARSWTIAGEFVDEGVSGVKERRPELDRLCAAVRRRAIDVVVIAALDRLGRSLPHLLKLLDEWGGFGARLVSLREGLDFSSRSGRLLFSIVGALAGFERDLLRDRIRSGIAARRARGLWVGRKPKLTPALIAQVTGLRVQGRSLGAIAKAVGLSKSTVFAAVQKTRAAASPEVPDLPRPDPAP
jgi:DNA invertase Pin-like site-specific DNA recombinase